MRWRSVVSTLTGGGRWPPYWRDSGPDMCNIGPISGHWEGHASCPSERAVSGRDWKCERQSGASGAELGSTWGRIGAPHRQPQYAPDRSRFETHIGDIWTFFGDLLWITPAPVGVPFRCARRQVGLSGVVLLRWLWGSWACRWLAGNDSSNAHAHALPAHVAPAKAGACKQTPMQTQ